MDQTTEQTATDWDAPETVTLTAGATKFISSRLRGSTHPAGPVADPAADVTVTVTRKIRALAAGFLETRDDPDRGGVNHDGIDLGTDTWAELAQAFPYIKDAPTHTLADLAAAEKALPRSLFDQWAAEFPWDEYPDDDNYYKHSGY